MVPPPADTVPRPRSPFVGREAELAAIAAHLDRGCRLVTITGPGGIGKTRVAAEFIHRSADHGDGPLFADLTDARDTPGLCDAVAGALELPGTASDDDPVRRVGAALAAEGPALLLLDCVDQAVEAAAEVLPRWLDQAVEARILVTSRQRLVLAEEEALEIGPLGLPGGEGGDDEAEAVQLFLDAARRLGSGRPLTDDDLPYVAGIVGVLEGMPLAIELAAPRLAVMGPRALLHRLRNRFEVLSGPRRGRPDRHATMRGTLDFSWRVLSRAEQALLARCTVFRGGFGVEAAEAVAEGDPDIDPGAVLDLLQSLRTRSLLFDRDDPVQPGERRLFLYDTIREYAADQAEHTVRDAHQRHAAYYVRRGREEVGIGGTAWAWLTAERENLLAVARRVVGRDSVSARAAEPALEALLLLEPVLLRRGPLETYAALFEPVLEATARSGADPSLYSRALAAQGSLLRRRGRGQLGAQSLVHALSIAREVGEEALVARVMLELGQALDARGEHDQARDHYHQARRGSGGDARIEGAALRGLGLLAVGQGDGADARALLEQAAARHRGDPFEEAKDLRALGRLNLDEGHLGAAHECVARARDLSLGCEDRRGKALADGLLAAIQHDQGDLATAREGYEDAIAHLARCGFAAEEARVMGRLAVLARQQDRPVEARALLGTAIERLRRAGDERLADQLRPHLDELDARAADGPPAADLVVGPEGGWFCTAGGERVSLHHRQPLRRVLHALTRQRLEHAGDPLDAASLLEAGWPGERIIPEAGIHRVRVAVSTLRKFGLRDVLKTRGSAYLLDPGVKTHLLE